MNDPKIPKILEQIRKQLLDIVPAVEKLIEAGQERQQFTRQQCIRQLPQLATVDDPKCFQDLGMRDRFLPARHDLVQQAQAVAHASAGFPRDHIQALRADFNPLPATDRRQMARDGRYANPSEIEALATRQDGDRDFMRFSGCEHEYYMGGRLFQGFQQRIESRRAEHMNFVDDINFVRAVGRHVFDVLTQLSDLIHTVVGRTVDFVNVYCMAGRNVLAGTALVAGGGGRFRLTIQCLGQNARNSGLARSPRAGEKQCMRHPPGGNRVSEGAGDMLLLENVRKALRPVFSG
mgnify:CR=1 FL=1